MLAPPGLVWKIPDVLGSPYTLLNSEVKKLQGPRPHSNPGYYLPLILNGLGLRLPWARPRQLLPTAQEWDKVTSVVAVLRKEDSCLCLVFPLSPGSRAGQDPFVKLFPIGVPSSTAEG